MKSTSTPSTIERQGPAAALVLVTHMHEHQLGMFRSISAPTEASPFFDVTIPEANAEAWLASGIEVTDVEVRPIGQGPAAGHRRESVVVTGLLQPYGIRLALKYFRRVDAEPLVSSVTDGCFQ